MSTREDRLTALAVLAEPLRRRLFLHLHSSEEPVSRDAAAEALGISRSVAAFHLDKLAEAGALDVEYRRPPGRSGPGAGRPTKFYRRTEAELDFSAPERRYDLAAAILARALEDAKAESIPVDAALRAAAHDYGCIIASSPGDAAASGNDEFARVAAVLTTHGYEPARHDDVMTLENCPFHALAEQHRDLVCGMNLDVIDGVLEGTAAVNLRAHLDPVPGRCCVTVCARDAISAKEGADDPPDELEYR
jgi:predicted ArsR family transcriptional regulator